MEQLRLFEASRHAARMRVELIGTEKIEMVVGRNSVTWGHRLIDDPVVFGDIDSSISFSEWRVPAFGQSQRQLKGPPLATMLANPHSGPGAMSWSCRTALYTMPAAHDRKVNNLAAAGDEDARLNAKLTKPECFLRLAGSRQYGAARNAAPSRFLDWSTGSMWPCTAGTGFRAHSDSGSIMPKSDADSPPRGGGGRQRSR